MGDYLDEFFDKFIEERQTSSKGLFERFKGPMIAEVVDTNDPIGMHRIRVRIPELHDSDMNPDDCPWVRMAPWIGGSQCGSWNHYSIGDLIYVMFDKNHPYMPLCIGSADATRRARYSLESVYTRSPTVLDIEANADEVFGSNADPDWLDDWLPHDRRPMSNGMKDRYGSCMMMNATGFFPINHKRLPSINGVDPLTNSNLENIREFPDYNDPDAKYMSFTSKYGNYMLLSDVGYEWWNEFNGDWDGDKTERQWERDRAKYITKTNTEQKYRFRDQRRTEMRTRYGHLFEMRDVGWNLSRQFEYDRYDQKILANNKTIYQDEPPDYDEFIQNGGTRDQYLQEFGTDIDHRWIKIRTKGGHLFQMYDKGFDPANDNLIKKRLNDNEFGEFMDQEGPSNVETEFGYGWWQDRLDGRFTRLITRYGYKFAIDDRGSSRTSAEKLVSPYGNGFLLKGRRPGNDGTQRGFGIDINEKDKLNHMILYSPRSQSVEINDQYDYIMMSTDTHQSESSNEYNISEPWAARGDNEFTTKTSMRNLESNIPFNSELHTYHLKLDNNNKYVRFKTNNNLGIPAGIESRNKSGLPNWTEINDNQDRGLWFTNDYTRSVWRSNTIGQDYNVEPLMWQSLNEQNNGQVLIINNGDVTQIYVGNKMELISGGDIMFRCNKMSITSAEGVHIDTGSTSHIINGGGIGTEGDMYCSSYHGFKIGCLSGPGASSPSPLGGSPDVPSKRIIDAYKPRSEYLDRARDDNAYMQVDRPTDIWGE